VIRLMGQRRVLIRLRWCLSWRLESLN